MAVNGASVASAQNPEDAGPDDLKGVTDRQVLDYLMVLDPAYYWRDMGGVAVILYDLMH
jgi:hypothetical protein